MHFYALFREVQTKGSEVEHNLFATAAKNMAVYMYALRPPWRDPLNEGIKVSFQAKEKTPSVSWILKSSKIYISKISKS